ncbi:MAG: oxidoreductase [Xanthobacteraceae bacterium]|nr:MAG: oxidoreductase [Xanthobacteraceae bacterium]
MLSSSEWRHARVIDVAEIAADVRAVTFAIEGSLPPFDPGSHLSIRVMIDGLPAVRSYTVIPSSSGTLLIAVKRHPHSRGGSVYIWSLKVGDATEVTVPENRFALSWRTSRYLLIAGGIGITPIYGMARALAARGQDFRLVYGAHSRAQMAFADELTALGGERVALFAKDEGRAIDLKAEIAALPADGELYMCGPLGILDAAKAAWAEAGRPVSRLRYEVFGDSGRFTEAPFRIEVPALNKVVEVRSDQSMLEALIQSGVDMIYDCQRGECGLCAVEVISADAAIDHRDVFFSPEEKAGNRRMCACVSRLTGGSAAIDIGYRGAPA